MSSPFARPGAPPPKGTAASRRYRTLLWIYTSVGLSCASSLFAMQKGAVDPGLKPFAVLGTIACTIGTVVSFRAGQRESREERAREERSTMLLIMAAELGKQPDEALERVARQKGMAGEAAQGILAERRRKRERGGDQPAAG